MMGSRDDAERGLARALSRHIGYTSGAYHLDRIFSVLYRFKDRTSAYKEELIAFISEATDEKPSDDLSAEYLAEIINFAVAMGLLEAVSARDAGLTRYAATEMGRSILGADTVNDPKFFQYYMAQVVLRADADFLVPVLLFFHNEQSQNLHAYFSEFQRNLREARLDWLVKTFPEKVLLERIADRIPWISRQKGAVALYKADLLSAHTVRHHATPRQGWVEQLGMFDRQAKRLTAFGEDVINALAPNQRYFWLSPPSEVLKSLAVFEIPTGLAEDHMDFATKGGDPTAQDLSRLVIDLRNIMISGYHSAKLIHASQASLQLPIEYILYRSYTDQVRYNWEQILELVFQDSRSQLERYSARKGKVGFYRVIAN